MSLDVYLRTKDPQKTSGSGIFIRENGSMIEISHDEWDKRNPGRIPVTVDHDEETTNVYWANITHNLGAMAEKAGIYKYLWRPEEIGISTAKDLVKPLSIGLAKLKGAPKSFKAMNPENGWGDYDGLVQFVEEYISACQVNPEAEVEVSR